MRTRRHRTDRDADRPIFFRSVPFLFRVETPVLRLVLTEDVGLKRFADRGEDLARRVPSIPCETVDEPVLGQMDPEIIASVGQAPAPFACVRRHILPDSERVQAPAQQVAGAHFFAEYVGSRHDTAFLNVNDLPHLVANDAQKAATCLPPSIKLQFASGAAHHLQQGVAVERGGDLVTLDRVHLARLVLAQL